MSDRFDPNDPFAGIEPYEGHSTPGGGPPAGPPSKQGPGGPPPRSPLLTGMVVGLLLVVASIALFQLFSSDSGGLGEAGGTTVAPEGSTGAPDGGTTTPPDDNGTATTGEPSGTTQAGNGGGTPYTAQGDPVPIEELTLAADGIGPVLLGQPAEEAIGRLIASLGEPGSDTGPRTSTGEYGVCDGDIERIVAWGPFAAVVVVDPDGQEFLGGYRLDLSYGGFSSEAAELATLSGIKLGDSFRNVEEVYDGFDVEQADDPELGEIWTVSSSQSGNLLLWGPLAEGAVRGIYSPDACTRF